jgi:hypothetical protein
LTEGIVIRMLAVALLAATNTADQERELPMPPWAFGLLSIAVFAALLAITYAFRSVGTKHSALSEGA